MKNTSNGKDEKLMQTTNLTLKRLGAYQRVSAVCRLYLYFLFKGVMKYLIRTSFISRFFVSLLDGKVIQVNDKFAFFPLAKALVKNYSDSFSFSFSILNWAVCIINLSNFFFFSRYSFRVDALYAVLQFVTIYCIT